MRAQGTDWIKLQRLLKKATDREELVTGYDGFVYFWLDRKGALSSLDLRLLADGLDLINQPWNDTIDSFFKERHDAQEHQGSQDLRSNQEAGDEEGQEQGGSGGEGS